MLSFNMASSRFLLVIIKSVQVFFLQFMNILGDFIWQNILQSAIIKLSQSFIGSNNLNLLLPTGGEFGTRHFGGKDSMKSENQKVQLRSVRIYLFIYLFIYFINIYYKQRYIIKN